MKTNYVDYIQKNNTEGSNRAGSYIRALDQLGPILVDDAPENFKVSSIWNITDADFVGELRNYVIQQQKLGDDGIFEGTENSSYWANRFYSASLKTYSEFLRTQQRGKGMGAMMKVDQNNDLLEEFVDLGLFCREKCLCMMAGLMAKRFLIFTGLSGSGKTLQALTFAKWITPQASVKDIFFPGAEIQSSNKTYYVKKADSHSIEFWNSDDSDSAVKVTLPREMIQEWVDYIEENNIPANTTARVIRETVKRTSKFSDQLHSFETHLKAAAFAVIESTSTDSSKQNYEVISVGADWTSNENLLGYPDALKKHSYRKPDNGALDLILRAETDLEHPYFLILDEMNLSHVERYFADFLSAMESGEPINLHDDTGEDWDEVPAKLSIPENLFVIGTVNVDETTYMFSPKVLDRANVIEFRVSDEEMKDFLEDPAKPILSSFAGAGVEYGKLFIETLDDEVELDEDVHEHLASQLMRFFPALAEAGAEFGYRTAHEIYRFVYFYELLGEDFEMDESDPDFDAAMDAAIMQKLLPKLHGSKKKLGPVLAALIRLCLKEDKRPDNDPIADDVLIKENALYPRSLEKLKRMRKRLQEHGFTSFAEA